MQYNKITITLTCWAFFLCGYVFSAEQTQPSDLKKEVQNTINKVEEDKILYYYNPAGKRDPFKSPLDEIKEQSAVVETGEVLEGIRKFSISTLRLTGIMSKGSDSIAIVKAPDGKSYSLKKDSRVGPNGTVKEVHRDKVVIEDKYRIDEKDYTGKTTTKTISNKIILSLQQKEGGKN